MKSARGVIYNEFNVYFSYALETGLMAKWNKQNILGIVNNNLIVQLEPSTINEYYQIGTDYVNSFIKWNTKTKFYSVLKKIRDEEESKKLKDKEKDKDKDKDKETETNTTVANETKPDEGETVYMKGSDWANVNGTLVDELNNREMLGEYIMPIPYWENERKRDSVVFKQGDHALIMMYENRDYSDKTITSYNKISYENFNINSYNVEFESGFVQYNNLRRSFVSYYFTSDEITLKLIGITRAANIEDMKAMIETMINSIEKEGNM